MSRYIDADALDRAFSKLRFNNDGELEHYGDRPNWYLWGSEIENLIADAPTIDIVRCVKCRKCKEQGGHANCGGYLYCTRQKTMVDEDCFCAWGEER